jgi:hypothetical protein
MERLRGTVPIHAVEDRLGRFRLGRGDYDVRNEPEDERARVAIPKGVTGAERVVVGLEGYGHAAPRENPAKIAR